MSLPLKSQQELYDLWIDTLQDEAPELTDTLDGSVIDGLAGVFSVAGMELQRYTIQQFNKTFFDLADGPEVTGGPDDLETLAVDHFGDRFARPGATNAVDTATFSRPTAAAGAITILAGTIIKTKPDANGTAYRYSTDSTVSLNASGPGSLSVSVAVTAVEEGSASNAAAGTLIVIESSLLDPTIVVTNTGNATGEDAQDDATYRATIRNLLIALRAATKAAIEAAALNVSGVVVATAIEIERAVIFYDIASSSPIGTEFFYIPFVTLYIADAGGSASGALIAEVEAAIDDVRAYGVFIEVKGATPIVINWTGNITLNPAGPNFALFSVDTTLIKTSMKSYLAQLGGGNDFVRATANAAILAIWGPAGTNDLTTFATSVPTGDVTIDPNETAVPGTMSIA